MPRLDGNILVVERIYNEIKNRIVNGEYLPGTHLIEADLSSEFKVSRVTIRDALRRLTYDELVVLKPNSGVWVRRLGYQDIVDLYTVREPLEMLAARLACGQPREKLQELTEICSAAADAVLRLDRISHRALNRKFHKAVVHLSGNQTLIQLLERLNTQMVANQFMALMSDEDIRTSQKSHEMLVDAIVTGQAERAEEVMREHILTGRKFALSSVRA